MKFFGNINFSVMSLDEFGQYLLRDGANSKLKLREFSFLSSWNTAMVSATHL